MNKNPTKTVMWHMLFGAVLPVVAGVSDLYGFDVIAHRGASGYLPQHTLAAKSLAIGLGIDFIEQDVVMTRDGHLVVAHDLHLNDVSDVASKFSGRARKDGKYYVYDFALAELKQLSMGAQRNGATLKYQGRYPLSYGGFTMPSLREELQMLSALRQSMGRNLTAYIEIKSPSAHQKQGLDPTKALLSLLSEFGWDKPSSPVIIQCFDSRELVRMRRALGTKLRLVQLIGKNSWSESSDDYDAMLTGPGLTGISRYADGIAPWFPQATREMVARAKQLGLFIHVYTLRADDYPKSFSSFDSFVEEIIGRGVDGAFSDHPDQVLRIAHARRSGK